MTQPLQPQRCASSSLYALPDLGTGTLAVRSSWGDGKVVCFSRGPCGSSPRAIPGLGAPCPPVPLPDLTPQLGMVCWGWGSPCLYKHEPSLEAQTYC
jgi:hypothetical protein